MSNNTYIDDTNNGTLATIFGYIEFILFGIKLWIIVICIMYVNMYATGRAQRTVLGIHCFQLQKKCFNIKNVFNTFPVNPRANIHLKLGTLLLDNKMFKKYISN